MSEGMNLHLYDSVLEAMLNSPAGEVGRYLNRVGNVILAGARPLAGSRTGHLRASLKKIRQERYARGQLIEVGSRLNYAHLVHEGTRPHVIHGHGGRVLAFNSGGRVHYARLVHHPGTRGKKYLTIPLRAAVR